MIVPKINMSGGHLTKEFFALVKAIGESKSKQEEDRIILSELSSLKAKVTSEKGGSSSSASKNQDINHDKKRAKEFLIRLLYVEMLGHDASFGYIKAVELSAATSIVHKLTGYLTCGCCLSPDHEFRFMLVNQLQRDLGSSNLLEVCGGLGGE